MYLFTYSSFGIFLSSLVLLVPDAKGSEIDFKSLPSCAVEDCLPFYASTIGCTKFTRNCFCNALAPINCARNNCTGQAWYALEDWYSDQCPGNPPLVSFDPGVPLSARKCLREWIVPNQCKASITRNCFCRLNDVRGAMTGCVEKYAAADTELAKSLAEDFYRDTCILKEDATGEQRPGEAADEEIIPAPGPPAEASESGNPKAEKVGLIVGLVASFITIITAAWWFFMGCCCGRAGRLLVGSKIFGEAPPAYSKV